MAPGTSLQGSAGLSSTGPGSPGRWLIAVCLSAAHLEQQMFTCALCNQGAARAPAQAGAVQRGSAPWTRHAAGAPVCRSCQGLERCQAAAWPLPVAAAPQVPDWDRLAVHLHAGTRVGELI